VARLRRLTRRDYDHDPLALAPELLGKLLISREGPTEVCARITEVEAYLGSRDPASHAYRGRTDRNAVMFGPPGHLYVYFVYGMHWCINVVAGHPAGDAGAVLLRGAVPLTGLDLMRPRRPRARRDADLTSGPAKLAGAFGLDRSHDGADLTRGPLGIWDDGVAPPARPVVTVRIGLREGRGDREPWRFVAPPESVDRWRGSGR
jgi:DNA-3-methyladenine glycosylase